MTAARLIFLGFFLVTYLSICEATLFFKDGFLGIGIDLGKGKCPPTQNVSCPCGKGRAQVNVTLAVCTFNRGLKIKCKLCNDVTYEKLCTKFEGCARCKPGGGERCLSCPKRKFGDWCENDCPCSNDGSCDRDGNCICTENYEGVYCEKKKGCLPPGLIEEPLQVVLSPPTSPVTAVYSCPQAYTLKGQAISTCLSNKQWSSPPPICLEKCQLLSAPAHGRLVFSGSELAAGVTAQITCEENYRLGGQRVLTCLENGTWDANLPVCEKLATCPDPGDVEYAQRISPPPENMRRGHFIQDSTITYSCNGGYEQIGADSILCLYDGTWSEELPTCLKVSTVVPDCTTPGSSVVVPVGISVRIFCPPECAHFAFRLWGTSIYTANSSVCQAAIHSGKITNSGGLVSVINNGQYSHFTGSTSNQIVSKSFTGRDNSFRFDKIYNSLIQTADFTDCPKGMQKLNNVCAYVSNSQRPEIEAEAICLNMGLQLGMPKDSDEQLRLVMPLNAKGISSVWAGKEASAMLETVNDTEELTPYETVDHRCLAATVSSLKFVVNRKNCNLLLNYVCMSSSEAARLASCDNPGELANGESTPIGMIDEVYYVGSSIEFKCNTLHYLKGADEISCTVNGTWSNAKPTCIKVDACEDPPTPEGGFLTFLPPLKTPADQRAAVSRSGVYGSRTARLPHGLSVPLPQNLPNPTTVAPGTESVSLPPGTQRIGTRAMYDCESRYYRLVGSKTRKCQGPGEWSGRPPTCMPICGRSDSPRSPFIVNGNASDIGQWPWQAGIARYLPDYNTWFLLCGGSLLNERWVITAAHCLTYAGTTLSIEPDKFQVYLGKYHRTDSRDDDYVQVRKILEIHIHPDYDPGLFDADIALVQLAEPVQLNSRVQPVCLPTEESTRENLVEGKRGVVTGWGMDENQTYSETLQQAALPVVSNKKCEQGYEASELPLTVTDNMFCAGFEQGKTDACSGDSGGPMVFTDESSKERRWVLEGIVSWGSPNGCGNPNQYGGFTTVSKFLDWIHLFF